MSEYRKKPIVIQATQWHRSGDHPDDNTEEFIDPVDGKPFQGEGKIVRYYRNPDDEGDRQCERCSRLMHWHGWIETLEGGHTVCPGDWIITGVQGEHYPCKPDIFEQTYDLVRR